MHISYSGNRIYAQCTCMGSSSSSSEEIAFLTPKRVKGNRVKVCNEVGCKMAAAFSALRKERDFCCCCYRAVLVVNKRNVTRNF